MTNASCQHDFKNLLSQNSNFSGESQNLQKKAWQNTGSAVGPSIGHAVNQFCHKKANSVFKYSFRQKMRCAV